MTRHVDRFERRNGVGKIAHRRDIRHRAGVETVPPRYYADGDR